MESFEIRSCIRGYHVYQNIWTPEEEELVCVKEGNNMSDTYSVAVKKGDLTVGHVPRRMSRMSNLFIRRGGQVSSRVEGRRQFSADLPQGGLEVPCTYLFRGCTDEIKKLRRLTVIMKVGLCTATSMKPWQHTIDDPETDVKEQSITEIESDKEQ